MIYLWHPRIYVKVYGNDDKAFKSLIHVDDLGIATLNMTIINNIKIGL